MLAKTETSGMIATRSKSISSIDDVSQSAVHIRSSLHGTHSTTVECIERKERKRNDFSAIVNSLDSLYIPVIFVHYSASYISLLYKLMPETQNRTKVHYIIL